VHTQFTRPNCRPSTGSTLRGFRLSYAPTLPQAIPNPEFFTDNPVSYIVVMDAGSSGTRVYIYGFSPSSGATLRLVSDTSQKTSPGLSAFANNASAAAAAIAPLIQLAVNTVPVAQQASTPIYLGATGRSVVT